MDGAARVTAGYQVVWRKYMPLCSELGGEQQQRQPFHLLRHRGRKETTGVGVHLLSLSVPSSFSQLVCGSLRWRLLPPSAAGQNLNEITNNKKTTLKSRRVSSRVKYMIVK